MNKFFKSLLFPVFLLIISGLTSCIDSGDEERPGMALSADYLASKVWGVAMFKDDGQDKSSLFNDVFVEFRPNFLFRVTLGCETVDGEWILSNDSTLLVIRIPGADEPFNQLADEWVVNWRSDNEMHLIEQDNKGDEEFLLKVAPLNALYCQSCEHISTSLTDDLWSVTNLIGNVGNLTDEVRGSYLEFKSDGTVVLHSDHYEISGSWVLTDECRQLIIQWYQDQVYPDFYEFVADNWIIGSSIEQLVSLENQASGTLELTRGMVPDCQDMHKGLLNTSWAVEFVSINQDDVTSNFSGTGFTLLENNQLATEVVIGPAVLGQWMLTGNCDGMQLEIQSGQLKELAKDWIIISANQETIKLVHEEGSLRMELHLRKGNPEPSENCRKAISHITYGKWSIDKFTSTKTEDPPSLKNYQFKFHTDGSVSASTQDTELIGTWYLVGDCHKIIMHFDTEDSLSTLNGKWEIERSDKALTLVNEKMQVKRTIEMVQG